MLRVTDDERRLVSDIPPPRELVSIDAAVLLAHPYEPPRFCAQHIIPEKSLVLLTGDTGSGKSAFLLHAAVAVALGIPIAGKFAAQPDLVVLYLNGEMTNDTVARYLQEAAAGLRVVVPEGRLHFEGADAVATWRFLENRDALAGLVDRIRPDIVILDTQRALLIDEENEASVVRQTFAWLRTHIVNAYNCSVIVAHHLRKPGEKSNSPRNRVSGSRDIIASVDVHLAIESLGGAVMRALLLDKTRTPFEGVCAGNEWPITAQLEFGAPNRSIFAASDPDTREGAALKTATAVTEAEDDIIASLEAEAPRSTKALNVAAASRKRAFENLRKAGLIVEAGKDGRMVLWELGQT